MDRASRVNNSVSDGGWRLFVAMIEIRQRHGLPTSICFLSRLLIRRVVDFLLLDLSWVARPEIKKLVDTRTLTHRHTHTHTHTPKAPHWSAWNRFRGSVRRLLLLLLLLLLLVFLLLLHPSRSIQQYVPFSNRTHPQLTLRQPYRICDDTDAIQAYIIIFAENEYWCSPAVWNNTQLFDTSAQQP